MFVLIFLKKRLQGSFFDKFLRYTNKFLAPLYYKSSKKTKILEEINFVFICYGGLGDCILTIPINIELSKRYKVTIFLKKKFKDLEYFLGKNLDIIYHEKNDLLEKLRKFENSNSNYILIQQSPIMKFMLFHFCLNRPCTVGYIYSQNWLSFEGIKGKKIKVSSINKIFKYELFLQNILSIENKTFHKFEDIYSFNKNKSYSKYRELFLKKYFILSPAKNFNWEMTF